MKKINIGKDFGPLAMPLAIIGTQINNKNNFMLCGWITRVDLEPNIWLISLDKGHHTVKGINENKTFSLNFPSADLVAKADYCGLHTGSTQDKSSVFEVFFGELKTAPMIAECPLCMELIVSETKMLPSSILIFGEVQGIYSESQYLLPDRKPDFEKINPLLLTMPDKSYRTLNAPIAEAWNIGTTYSEE